MKKYRAFWHDYRLLVEFKDDHWEASVYDLTKQQWCWKGPVKSSEDGKFQALELALHAARVSDEEADLARRYIQWTSN